LNLEKKLNVSPKGTMYIVLAIPNGKAYTYPFYVYIFPIKARFFVIRILIFCSYNWLHRVKTVTV